MKLGIDIDDVIAEFVPSFLIYHNKKRGLSLQYKDIKTYDINEYSGISKDDLWEDIKEFYQTSEFHNLTPVKGIDTLSNSDHDIYFVTARLDSTEQPTINWLDRYNLIQDDNRLFMNVKNKGHLCKMLNLDVLIDDSIKNLNTCEENGIVPVVFDRPWNQGYDFPRKYRW